MTTFIIEPMIGALPIRFGMTPSEVDAILGPPVKVMKSYFGSRSELRSDVNIGYTLAKCELAEAIFKPGAKLLYLGKDLFSEPDPIKFLMLTCSKPQLCVGLVVFLHVGVHFSGFHDGDESQKSIAVTGKGYWDEFADDMSPFDE